MGLRDDIQADMAQAYDTDLADAVTAFTGTRTVAGIYDPVTGTTPSTTLEYQGRGVFGRYKAAEAAGSSLVATGETQGQHILQTDVKLTGVLQNELVLITDNQPAEPQVDDVIDGFTVLDVAQDPAGATWTLQLRKT